MLNAGAWTCEWSQLAFLSPHRMTWTEQANDIHCPSSKTCASPHSKKATLIASSPTQSSFPSSYTVATPPLSSSSPTLFISPSTLFSIWSEQIKGSGWNCLPCRWRSMLLLGGGSLCLMRRKGMGRSVESGRKQKRQSSKDRSRTQKGANRAMY